MEWYEREKDHMNLENKCVEFVNRYNEDYVYDVIHQEEEETRLE